MKPADAPVDIHDEAALQLDGDGNLRHLLTLKGLDKDLLIDILDDAEGYLTGPGRLPACSDLLAGRTVANLFFEASTRTRASFDLVGKRLGADGSQSVITQQVTNGVAVRMAVLERVGRLMAKR